MKKFLLIIKAEIIQLLRNKHYLAVLFLMPALFIIVLSTTLKPLFEVYNDIELELLVLNKDNQKHSSQFIRDLKNQDNIKIKILDPKLNSNSNLSSYILEKNHPFLVVINNNFSSYIDSISKTIDKPAIKILTDPTVPNNNQLILQGILQEKIVKLKLDTFYNNNNDLLTSIELDRETLLRFAESGIKSVYVSKNPQKLLLPNSVQQSVPSWLVFAMFFLVIPIANIFIEENCNGTLLRLKSIHSSKFLIVLTKVLPYYFINMIQVILMIFLGVYILPLLTGQSLSLGHSITALFIMASSISIMAISFGIFIASVSKSFIMASALGVTIIIIFAAIGGLMVPIFFMPKIMKTISELSPLSWGVQGFLDLFLRNGSTSEIIPESIKLWVTSAVLLTISSIIIKKKLSY